MSNYPVTSRLLSDMTQAPFLGSLYNYIAWLVAEGYTSRARKLVSELGWKE